VLFLVANVWSFQPWPYDNIRLLGYGHVFAAVAVGSLLARLYRASATGAVVALQLTLLATLTGFFTIAREARIEFRLCGPEGVVLAKWVEEQTTDRSVFLTAGIHTEPISMLAGRRLALGADCWLLTHGAPWDEWHERIDLVNEIYRGKPGAAAALARLKIDYVLVGPDERSQFAPVNEAALAALAKEQIRIGDFVVYRVSDGSRK
jgi:hypothetical protein